MEITIDRAGCVSCALCVDTCPAVYEMGSDGLAQIANQPTDANEDLARRAADGCPVSVIHVT